MVTHLIEVAGLILDVPFIRFLLALTVAAIILDAYVDRRRPGH
jgi:hypothetical protein